MSFTILDIYVYHFTDLNFFFSHVRTFWVFSKSQFQERATRYKFLSLTFIFIDNDDYYFTDLNLFFWDVRTHFFLWNVSYVLSSVTCHFNLKRSCHDVLQWIIVCIWYWIWLQIFFFDFLVLEPIYCSGCGIWVSHD